MYTKQCQKAIAGRLPVQDWLYNFGDGEWDIAEALLCVFRAFRTSPANLGGRGAVQPPSLL
jgi:hypothetical protein